MGVSGSVIEVVVYVPCGCACLCNHVRCVCVCARACVFMTMCVNDGCGVITGGKRHVWVLASFGLRAGLYAAEAA